MYIPAECQSIDMCRKAVEYDHLMLEHCEHIDSEMMHMIFKRQTIPRKNRFDFIKYYNERLLLKIIKARPSLIEIIPEKKRTDIIIDAALETNGYAIRHIDNPTADQINRALNSHPGAIKYVKHIDTDI